MGDAGGCLQGGPSLGVFPHGFGPGGGRGPLCWTLAALWLDTPKKNKCYDSKNNVEKPHDSLGGEANRLGDEIKINWICRWYAYEEEMVLIVIYKHAYPM